MRKLLSVFLVLVLLCSFAACGGSAAGNTTAPSEPLLKVGFAKVDITPLESVALPTDAEGGMSTGILDYMYITCVYLIDDTGKEMYLLAFDICNMYPPLPAWRYEIATMMGVSDEQVMFSASHTHSSVEIKAVDVPSVARYNDQLRKGFEKAVQQAKADAKPATGMYHASIETESLNFTRRYIMDDGSLLGDNCPGTGTTILRHETKADPELQLLKFTREGGKDVILTNFQTHPHRTAYDTDVNTNISSDIVGVYREELEKQLDCHALYYTGSSGNVNPTSKIKEENIYNNHREHGKAMAKYAVEASKSFVELSLGRIQTVKTTYEGTTDLSEQHLINEAKVVSERYTSGMNRVDALKGYEHLFVHPRHAMAILSRAGTPPKQNVLLYSFSVGDFTACYAPFELFSKLGEMIKENSPFPATFVCCYSTDIFSYLPDRAAYANGGYGAYKCNFVPGTGEEIVDEFLKQMETMYANK